MKVNDAIKYLYQPASSFTGLATLKCIWVKNATNCLRGNRGRMTMMMGLNMIAKDRANMYAICQSIQSVRFNCFASYIQNKKYSSDCYLLS